MRIFSLTNYIICAVIIVTGAMNLITMVMAQPPGSVSFVDWIIITVILAIAYVAFSLFLDEIITHVKNRKDTK